MQEQLEQAVKMMDCMKAVSHHMSESSPVTTPQHQVRQGTKSPPMEKPTAKRSGGAPTVASSPTLSGPSSPSTPSSASGGQGTGTAAREAGIYIYASVPSL